MICLLWKRSHLAVDAGRFATRTSWGVAKPSPIFSRKFIELVAIPASRIDYVGDRLDNNIIPVRDVGYPATRAGRCPNGVPTDLTAPKPDFRSSPESGLKSDTAACPFR